MKKKASRRKLYGQSQVEYIVILALVSLVVIAAGSALGPAINRVFGVVTGALGTQYNTVGSGHTIEIVTAVCESAPNPSRTGLWVSGNTDEPVDQLVGSTNLAVGTGLNGESSPVTTNNAVPGTFLFNPILVSREDLSICPSSVVIQATDGAIAIAPVTRIKG